MRYQRNRRFDARCRLIHRSDVHLGKVSRQSAGFRSAAASMDHCHVARWAALTRRLADPSDECAYDFRPREFGHRVRRCRAGVANIRSRSRCCRCWAPSGARLLCSGCGPTPLVGHGRRLCENSSDWPGRTRSTLQIGSGSTISIVGGVRWPLIPNCVP